MKIFDAMPIHSDQDLLSLRAALCQKSIRFGDFTLASGGKSDVYVDAKLTTCSAEWISVIGRVFLNKMLSRQWFPKAVGGLTLGADPIAFAIAGESVKLGHSIDAFIVRKEPKKHGRQRAIEGLDQTEGVPVVILDDVCTRGDSTRMAMEHAIDAGMNVIGAMCLVDRGEGAAELIATKFGVDLERIFTLSDLRVYQNECRKSTEAIEANI